MREFRNKYLWICSIVFFVFITCVTAYYIINASVIKKNRIGDLKTIALLKEEQVAHWYDERIANAVFYTTSPFSVDIYSQYLNDGSTKAIEQIIQRNNLIVGLYGFDKVSSVDIKKQEINADPTKVRAIPDVISKYIDSALLTKQIYLTNFFLSEKDKKPLNAIVAPVKTASQEVLAIMVFYITPVKYLYSVKETLPPSFKTSKFTLISPMENNDSSIILGFSKVKMSGPVNFSIVKGGDSIERIFNNEKGHSIVSVKAFIPDLSWYIVLTVDRNELLSEVQGRTFLFATIIFFIFLGFLISMFYLLREKQARRELLLKTSEHENFFNNTIEMLCLADKNGFFRRLNPEWQRVLGYAVTELQNKPYIEFVHPDDVESTIEATKHLGGDKEINNFINRYRHKDGSYRWIEWRSVPMGEFIYASARDITERIITEQSLQENIVRAQAFLNAMDEGIVISENGIIVEVNKQCLKMLGYDDESEIIGKSILEEFTPSEVRNEVQEHITTNNSTSYQTISYRKDKSVFPVEIRGNTIILRNKKMRMTTIRDITSQKRAEQELRETDLWLRDSQHNSHIGSYNFSISTGKWKSSEELDVIFGISHNYDKSIEGWIKLIHPEHQREISDHLLHYVIEQKNPFDRIYQIIRQNDREVRWVRGLGNLTFDNTGTPMQMIGTIQDVTEQRNAEDELRVSEQRFRSIFENSSLGIALIGFDGKYLMVNNAMCRIIGYSTEEILNKTFYDITYPDDIDTSRNALDYIQHNDNIKYIKRYIHKEGNIVWAEVSSRIIYSPSCEPLYFVSHINDITEKKLAEDIKRENEEKFRIAFDNSPTGMSMIRADGTYVAVNELLCQMLGYSEEELLSGNIANITHPDDVERSFQWIKRMIDGDTSEPEFEKRFIHKDGHVVWGLIRSQWLRNADGSPRLSITHILDITQRKKAEEAIRESEQKYRLLFENMTSGFALHQMIYDDQGNPYDYRYIEANPSFYKLTGIPDGYMTGKTVREVLPNIEEHWIQTFGKVAQTMESLSYMNYAFDLGKYYETYVFSPEKDKFAVVFNDATNRVLAENELKISEWKYSSIVNLSPDMVGITRMSDGKLINGNPALTKMLGFTPDEYLEKTTLELGMWVNTEHRNEVIRILNETGEVNNFETSFRAKDGANLTCLFSARKLDYNNEPCLIFIVHDISDRKKFEEEMLKLNSVLEQRVFERTSQLTQANKDLESFAYSVSHDLRAPLRHIDGFVRLMYSNIEQPKGNVTDYFEKIHAATGRMSVMIDDLLTFSRLGRKEFVTSFVDINFLINEIIEQLKPDIVNRKISWILHQLPQLRGDKSLLKMAFENLISNAIKYTSRKPVATIEIGSNELTNDMVEIFIKDDGVGFDMKYVDKLFGVFQRLHSSEEFEGTGIGLANVKQIVSKHNGSIRAEGKLNEGAIFYLTLPK